MRVLVTGGAGFIGHHLVTRTPYAGRRCGGPRRLQHRPPMATRTVLIASPWSRATSATPTMSPGRPMGRRRPARGGDPFGRALGRRSAAIEFGQRRRHDPAHAGLCGGRRSPRRRRRVVIRLRREPGAAAARDAAPRSSVALRRQQARDRAIRAHHRRTPRDRDGRAALLQRVRPRPGPAVPVRRRRAALRHRGPDGPATDGPRRWTAVTGLHLRRQRRVGEPPRGHGPRCHPVSRPTSAAGGDSTCSSCSIGSGTRSERWRSPIFAPTRAGDVRDSEADITVARDRLGYEVVSRSMRACAARSTGTGSSRWHRASGRDPNGRD